MYIRLLPAEDKLIVETHFAIALNPERQQREASGINKLTAQDLVKRMAAAEVEPKNEKELNLLTDAILGCTEKQDPTYSGAHLTKILGALPNELQQRFEDFHQYWQNATRGLIKGDPEYNCVIQQHLVANLGATVF
jgi:hypothetical protein